MGSRAGLEVWGTDKSLAPPRDSNHDSSSDVQALATSLHRLSRSHEAIFETSRCLQPRFPKPKTTYLCALNITELTTCNRVLHKKPTVAQIINISPVVIKPNFSQT